jgi:uncharacterized repeat protein (TIGR03899 family)
MLEINLIKLEGKPFEKLIKVISDGIGTLYRPRSIRKEADAKAYEIEIIEKAKAKALAEGNESEAETYIRIQERLIFTEVERQKNIDNVVEIAAEQLNQESTVSDEPVNKDWSKRFFNIVEDISDEEMQTLWGRILAGEIKQPKTYSLRTLELIRNLSKYEADVFTKVADYAIKFGNANYLFKGSDEKLFSKNHKISDSEIALLMEIGLIQNGDKIMRQILQVTTESQIVFTAGNIIMIAKIKANNPTIHIPVYVFSSSGNELLKLIKTITPFDYLTLFAKSVKNKNVDIKYGYILGRNGTNVTHTQPLQEFTE